MTATSPEVTAIGKLLLNAWSAEYALRIKPVSTDRDYLNESLNWTLPQAYYAVLFSSRAVLLTDGIRMARPSEIEKLMKQWAKAGKYGPAYTQNGDPFADLIQHKIMTVPHHKHISAPEAAAIHIKLKDKVHAIGIMHETYIANRLGHFTYELLIDNLPEYIRNDFVGARACLILSDD